jgi:hypothetical protein
MKRLLTAAAASLLLTLALVAPVGAADPGPGCSDFGAATASLAKDWHPFGQVVSGVAQGGPRGASWLIQAEHAGDVGTYPCTHP